jgi:hypothetical protein
MIIWSPPVQNLEGRISRDQVQTQAISRKALNSNEFKEKPVRQVGQTRGFVSLNSIFEGFLSANFSGTTMLSLTIPIVSVHTPKTAGSAFLLNLRHVYGNDSVMQDYDDDPASHLTQIALQPFPYKSETIKTIAPYRVVHGHFRPEKYNGTNNAFRLTFLRHPVDNVISIYRFWRAASPKMRGTPLFHFFKQQALSVEQLAMLPAIRFLYSKTYFGGFEMKRFDFIGDYVDYSQELKRLGQLLGVKFDLDLRDNVTLHIPGDDPRSDPSKLAVLTKILTEDIKFYEQHARK